MTDLASALADTSQLNDFEGLPVRRAAIEIPGAAGGLREAMKIEPREFHKGERVWIVLECEVGKIRFDPVTKDEPAGDQVRVHIFDVDEAAFIEEEVVSDALKTQRDKIKRAQEAAKGILRLPTDEELLRQHEAGEHEEPVDACVECEKQFGLLDASEPGDGEPAEPAADPGEPAEGTTPIAKGRRGGRTKQKDTNDD